MTACTRFQPPLIVGQWWQSIARCDIEVLSACTVAEGTSCKLRHRSPTWLSSLGAQQVLQALLEPSTNPTHEAFAEKADAQEAMEPETYEEEFQFSTSFHLRDQGENRNCL